MQEPRQLFGGLGNRMFQMAYIFTKVMEGELPDIYLQDHKYFQKYEKELKAYYGNGIVKSDYISLHIRRGDYVNNPFYVDLTKTDYYDKAIAMFPNEKFLIFCADRQNIAQDDDDQNWCLQWARTKDIDFEIWKTWNEIEDFNRMAGCKAHIMANSSFSWWASFVGEGKTIAPLQWFANGRGGPLLDEWVKI